MFIVNENFLITDTFNEAIFSLEVIVEWLERVEKDVYYWKWIILALHNSVQGFMVLALQGSNGLMALSDNSLKKVMESYKDDKPPPVSLDKLDSFLNLYKKVKSKETMCFYIHSKEVTPSSTLDRNMKKLNSLRNDFVHFVPKLLGLEVSSLPEMCIDCLGLIYFLALKCGNVILYKDGDLERCKRIISTIKRILTRFIEASRTA